MPASPYFSRLYFDSTYFDTDSGTVIGGGRRLLPPPPLDLARLLDDELLVLD